jgi:hypothetical protein
MLATSLGWILAVIVIILVVVVTVMSYPINGLLLAFLLGMLAVARLTQEVSSISTTSFD